MNVNYAELTQDFKDFIDTLVPEETFISNETVQKIFEEVSKELPKTGTRKQTAIMLMSIRSSVIKHFDEKRDIKVDKGRLSEDDRNRMNMIICVIENMVYTYGGSSLL